MAPSSSLQGRRCASALCFYSRTGKILTGLFFCVLDEIHRNANQDVFKGMKLLKAVEILEVLNQDFQSDGNIVIKDYLDPYSRYEQYLEAVAGYEGLADHMVEHFYALLAQTTLKS